MLKKRKLSKRSPHPPKKLKSKEGPILQKNIKKTPSSKKIIKRRPHPPKKNKKISKGGPILQKNQKNKKGGPVLKTPPL